MKTETNNQQRDRIKLAARALYDTQKLRISLGNRVERLVREGIMEAGEAKNYFEIPTARMVEAEKAMEKSLKRELRGFPVYERWLKNVRGIGPRLAGILIGNIYNIQRFATISKLWQYSGLGLKNGSISKRKRGEKASWNNEMKMTLVQKFGDSIIKLGGPYRKLYDTYKSRIIEREVNNGTIIYGKTEGGTHWTPIHYAPHVILPANPPKKLPEWTLKRIDLMARRYAAKRFEAHLMMAWYQIEGLALPEPYVASNLGHEHVDSPWDYVDEKPVPT